MNQVAQLAETVKQKQVSEIEQDKEEFEIVKVRIDDNQFNMTVKNTGDIPVHLTRLWVENTTDSTWPTSKYDLDIALAPGNSTRNIGQNIGLSALNTQSYMMDLVTERGNNQQMFLNSVGTESKYINLRATPATIATGFTSTFLLEVVNTGTTQLLNLQPEINSIVTACDFCSYSQVSGPNPTIIESLNPGDTAIFEYVYSLTGDLADSATITASLVNGLDTDSATITIQDVESAENANVVLQAAGIGPSAPINGGILVFHMETSNTPESAYQMYSGSPEGGANGLRIQLESEDPTFITMNGTQQVNIPAGDWVASLAVQSEAMPPSLIDQDVDMIFHFEDGQDVDPDNSEGSSSRDLEGCGGVGCSGWYDEDWSSRKQIVIQGDQIVGGAHTNFPVMVELVGDAELIASAQADGDDILFTNSDGTVKLDHEIEHYNGGTLVAWVKVPILSSGTDVAICMYFGNAAASNQENVAGTWSDNYEAVYHFHNDFNDSANSNDGTNNGSVNATGIAGGGQDFEERDNDYVNAGTWSVSGDELTLQAWVNWENPIPNNDPRIISKNDPTKDGSTQNFVFMLGEDSKRVRERIKTGDSDTSGTTTLLAGTGTMSTGTWYLMAVNYDGSNMRVFLDGVDRGNTGKTGNLRENSWPIWIGSSSGTSPREFDGIMDEVRISSEARSANWLQTEYNNLNGGSPFLVITSGGGGGNPTWVDGSGPHGSGSYLFDGVSTCFESKNNVSDTDDNDIDEEVDTTALWFKTNGGEISSEQYLVYWDGDGTCPACDYYKISLDPTGKVLFEFDSDQGGATTTCLTTNDYDDDTWYHVTAVRGVAANDNTNSDDCVMHVHDATGASLEKVSHNRSYPSANTVDADGRWTVGTNQEKDDFFFDGYIDDIMHWNGDNGNEYLTTDEAEDLARTNYGDAAHKIDFHVTVTDKDGNFVSSLVSDLEIDVPFHDPKTVPSENTEDDDTLYSYFNYTMPITAQTIDFGQRVNFTMNWVSSTTEFPNWEPLDLDMKVDDTGFITPFPSYLQIPQPSPSFPSYYIYDNDVEMNVFVSNAGTDGVFYVSQGTRVNFNGTLGSFTGMIHSINGTCTTPTSECDWRLEADQDSIYFAPGEMSSTYFHIPTDHPSSGGSLGTQIPPGVYLANVWAEGYSDQGEGFSRTITLGTVTVVD